MALVPASSHGFAGGVVPGVAEFDSSLSVYPGSRGAAFVFDDPGAYFTLPAGVEFDINDHTTQTIVSVTEASGVLRAWKGVRDSTITLGALPTVAPSSGVAFQCSTTRDVHLTVPVTFNPTAGAAATCLVELSPDNTTFSPLGTMTEPAGIAFDGTIHLLQVVVRAGWRVRLTVVNATLGTGTYY